MMPDSKPSERLTNPHQQMAMQTQPHFNLQLPTQCSPPPSPFSALFKFKSKSTLNKPDHKVPRETLHAPNWQTHHLHFQGCLLTCALSCNACSARHRIFKAGPQPPIVHTALLVMHLDSRYPTGGSGLEDCWADQSGDEMASDIQPEQVPAYRCLILDQYKEMHLQQCIR